jgi:WD40 repeat protein
VITCITFLANQNLASGSMDGCITIWSYETSKILQTIKAHFNYVNSLIQLRDGRLASCSKDRTVKIWNSESGSLLSTIKGFTHLIKSIIELNNGNIVGGLFDGTIKIANPHSSTLVQKIEGAHDDWIMSLVLLENGYFASGSRDA